MSMHISFLNDTADTDSRTFCIKQKIKKCLIIEFNYNVIKIHTCTYVLSELHAIT